MGGYKHIETCTAEYLAGRYRRAAEVGIGANPTAAQILQGRGALLRCTDIRRLPLPAGLPFSVDDVFSPDLSLYEGADVIYAVRPAVEMVPPLIELARAAACDLIVYHLGFECWGTGGELIDCGVLLHRYYRASEDIEG